MPEKKKSMTDNALLAPFIHARYAGDVCIRISALSQDGTFVQFGVHRALCVRMVKFNLPVSLLVPNPNKIISFGLDSEIGF